MKEPTRYRPTVREHALFLIGTAIVAVVYTLDSFGFHLRSRGEPGWWEYSMAALWWGVTGLAAKELRRHRQQ
jgi:hypothetical protein